MRFAEYALERMHGSQAWRDTPESEKLWKLADEKSTFAVSLLEMHTPSHWSVVVFHLTTSETVCDCE